MASFEDILSGTENGEVLAEGDAGAVALPNFGANENGQVQDGNIKTEVPKSWEIPLRIPEIRKSSNNWSLASDAGLLLYLQEFSQNMIAKTSDLEKQVDGLVNEAKNVDSRVHNVFNDFLMLANTQFIENRVYDDADDIDQEKDLVSAARKDECKSREQREAEVIPRVTKALSLGINVLDTAFEQLDPHIGDSDSDDEDATYKAVDPILEPKDLYAHRALPYIIGTPAFMQDDDVGLAFSEEEEELTEDEDDEDEAESDLSDESEFTDDSESSDMEESDTTGTPRSKKGLETKSGTEESDDGDLFGADKSDDDDEDIEGAKPKAPGYADELAAKLGAAAAAGADASGENAEDDRQRSVSETESSKGKKKKKVSPKEKERRKKRSESKNSEDNLFGEPAELEDDESPFNKKGLFSSTSGGGGLFDDEDKVEGGLFGDKPGSNREGEEEEDEEEEGGADHIYEDIKGLHPHEQKTTRSGRKIPAGGVALFGAETSEDLFGTSPQSRQAARKASDASSDNTAASKSSAGGLFEAQDEDELFAESSSKPAAQKKGAKNLDLFDDGDDDDLFGDKSAAASKQKRKLPAGAVPIFGEDAPNPLAGKLSPTKTPSDEEEKSSPAVAKKPAKSGGGGLFDEGDDADLFGSESQSDRPSAEKRPSNDALFDEEENDSDIFATEPAPKGNRPKADSSLFDDLGDEGGDENDLFAKPKEPTKKKPVGGVALFGGADMFGTSPKKEPEKPLKNEVSDMRDRRTNTLSLFNDDDEKDTSGMFAKKPQRQKAAKPTMSEKEEKQNRRRTKSKSVFDDEDVLFGNKDEEDPSVDLFGSGSPVSPEKYANAPTRFRPRGEVISRSRSPHKDHQRNSPPPRPRMPPPNDDQGMSETDVYLAPDMYDSPIPARSYPNDGRVIVQPPDLPPRSFGGGPSQSPTLRHAPPSPTARQPPASPTRRCPESPTARRPPKPLPKVSHASNSNNNIPPGRPDPMSIYPKPYRKVKPQPSIPPPPFSILEHHQSPPTSPASPIKSNMMNKHWKSPSRPSAIPCFRTLSSPLSQKSGTKDKNRGKRTPPPRPKDPPSLCTSPRSPPSYNVFHCQRATPNPNPKNCSALPLFDFSNGPANKILDKLNKHPAHQVNGFHKQKSPPMPLPKPTNSDRPKYLPIVAAPIRQSSDWSSGHSSPGWSSGSSHDSFSSESDFEFSPMMQRKAYATNDEGMPPSPVWCTTPDHDPPSGYEASSNIQAILRSALEAAAKSKSLQQQQQSSNDTWDESPSGMPSLTPPPPCDDESSYQTRRIPSPPMPPRHHIIDATPDKHFIPVQSADQQFSRSSPPVLIPQAQRWDSSPEPMNESPFQVPFREYSPMQSPEPIQSPTLPRWDKMANLADNNVQNLESKQAIDCPFPSQYKKPTEAAREQKAPRSKSPTKAFVPLPTNCKAKNNSKPPVDLPSDMLGSVSQRRKAIEAFFNQQAGSSPSKPRPVSPSKTNGPSPSFLQACAKIAASKVSPPVAGKPSGRRYTPPSYRDASVAAKKESANTKQMPPVSNIAPPRKDARIPTPPPIPPHGWTGGKPWRECAEPTKPTHVNGIAASKSPTKMPKWKLPFPVITASPATNGHHDDDKPRIPRWNHVKHVTSSRDQILRNGNLPRGRSPSPDKKTRQPRNHGDHAPNRHQEESPFPAHNGRSRDRSASPVKQRRQEKLSPPDSKNGRQRDLSPSPVLNGRSRDRTGCEAKKQKDRSVSPEILPCVLSPKTRRKMIAAHGGKNDKTEDSSRTGTSSPSPVRKHKGPTVNHVNGTKDKSHAMRNKNTVSPSPSPKVQRKKTDDCMSPNPLRKRLNSNLPPRPSDKDNHKASSRPRSRTLDSELGETAHKPFDIWRDMERKSSKLALDRTCSSNVLMKTKSVERLLDRHTPPPHRPNKLPIVDVTLNGNRMVNGGVAQKSIWDQDSSFTKKPLPPHPSLSNRTLSSSRSGRSKVAPKPLPKPVNHSKASIQKSLPGSHWSYAPQSAVASSGRPAGTVLRNVRALQANMSIDPSALRPGASPPSREIQEDPIGFDIPAQANTLDTGMAKGRAKMSTKRRPPSRHSRHAAARLSSNPANYGDYINDAGVPEEAYQDLPSPSDLSPFSQNRPAAADSGAKPKSKPASSDLFGNDDLFSDNTNTVSKSKADMKRTPPMADKPVKSTFNDEDDLFSVPSLPVKKVETKKQVPNLVDDDLFAGSSVPPPIKKEKKPIVPDIDVDDDLFAVSAPPKKASPEPSLIDDDLFATTAPSPKKKETKKQILEDDEDDLFGEKKPTPKKTKSKPTKSDKDLFSDTTDIFADVPSKPKEKKKKKTQDQGLFGDVPGDDIFASPSAAASKPKKNKTKKKTADKKAAAASADDIFSTDAPSIFDDPLSALNK